MIYVSIFSRPIIHTCTANLCEKPHVFTTKLRNARFLLHGAAVVDSGNFSANVVNLKPRNDTHLNPFLLLVFISYNFASSYLSLPTS
jgi:hypothetical protein